MARKVEPKPKSVPQAIPKKFSLIGDAKLRQLYTAMLRCRALDESLRELARATQSRYLSSIGHEAALVGVAIDLRREDWILPQHRFAVAALLRAAMLPGGPPQAILARVRNTLPRPSSPGAELPASIPLAGNIVPPTGSTAASLNIAVGLALAAQSRQKGQVVMAFCESDAASSRQLAEALRFAATRRLPLLLLALSAATRASKPAAPGKKTRPAVIVAEAGASGIPVIPVDHADAVAMYRVAFESIHKARHEGGPTLIETANWPFPEKLRESNNPASSDPLVRMEEYLAGKGLFSERWKRSIVDRFHREAALLQQPLSRNP